MRRRPRLPHPRQCPRHLPRRRRALHPSSPVGEGEVGVVVVKDVAEDVAVSSSSSSLHSPKRGLLPSPAQLGELTPARDLRVAASPLGLRQSLAPDAATADEDAVTEDEDVETEDEEEDDTTEGEGVDLLARRVRLSGRIRRCRSSMPTLLTLQHLTSVWTRARSRAMIWLLRHLAKVGRWTTSLTRSRARRSSARRQTYQSTVEKTQLWRRLRTALRR